MCWNYNTFTLFDNCISHFHMRLFDSFFFFQTNFFGYFIPFFVEESLIQHFYQLTFQDIFPLCNFWADKVCYVDPTPALFHLAELWVVIRCAWITFRAWVTKLKSQEWYCSGSFILFNLKSTYVSTVQWKKSKPDQMDLDI